MMVVIGLGKASWQMCVTGQMVACGHTMHCGTLTWHANPFPMALCLLTYLVFILIFLHLTLSLVHSLFGPQAREKTH